MLLNRAKYKASNFVKVCVSSSRCLGQFQAAQKPSDERISAVDVLPKQARVIIAGAGVVGNSVAYHLSEMGCRDILVLDQNQIGSGSSNFGSGILGLLKPMAMRTLIQSSFELYQRLEKMGFPIRLAQCGSLNLAQSEDRLIALKRRMAHSRPNGLMCQLLSPLECQQMNPLLNLENLVGGVWAADDAVVDPLAVCMALAELAKRSGVRYVENCEIKQILTDEQQVRGVRIDSGDIIECEYFVNCAGMWSRELGLKCEPTACIPTYPANHFYAIADINEDLSKLVSTRPETTMLPIVRDYDGQTYIRQWTNPRQLLIGWFERNAMPAFNDRSQVTKDCHQVLKQQNDDDETMNVDYQLHCQTLWQNACQRVPILSEIEMPKIRNSPNTFTPDGRWIFGETAEVRNYFVACGMNGNALQGAGGIGRAVAEWLIEGRPTQELQTFSVQRFLHLHNNRKYLQQRTKEIVGRHYQILYPHQCEYREGRKLRCSPLYSVLESRGAVFGIKMAYERALYFDSQFRRGDKLPRQMPTGSFYKPQFIEFMRDEYNACREGAGIIDMSSFSKIEIKPGVIDEKRVKYTNEVLNYLQKMCSNDVNCEIGSIVHTGMLNENGGYENDCMLVRQEVDRFFMVSPSSQQTRILKWMRQHLPQNDSVCLNDVTSMYTVLNVVGPKSMQLMSELSNTNIELLPFQYRKINVAYASDVMVMSFTNTGEPGYCLFVPSEYALHVYDRLMSIGRDFGARDVGTLVQRFMRIENFIPFWAEELTSFVTPFETGCGGQVKLDKKDDFIGKTALQTQQATGITKRLGMFHVDQPLMDTDKDVWPWGSEPIYCNNEFVGNVTSVGYSFSKNQLICLGFIRCEPTVDSLATATDKRYEIDIADKRFPISLQPAANGNSNLNNGWSPNLAAKNPQTNEVAKPTYKPTVVKFKKNIIC